MQLEGVTLGSKKHDNDFTFLGLFDILNNKPYNLNMLTKQLHTVVVFFFSNRILCYFRWIICILPQQDGELGTYLK